MNKNITAMVFALNEERRISSVYENFKDFCNIIVFDGGSTDGTELFCKQKSIQFVRRPEDNGDWQTRLNNMAWVYENTPTEYVIHVYGTHFFPKPLLEYFGQVANENQKSAVYHDVVIYRYGSVVHKPFIRRVSSVCTFCRKSIINLNKSKIHDELAIQFDAKTMVRLPGKDELSLRLFHDEDCESFTKKTIKYEAIEARQKFKAGERVSWTQLVFGPPARFFYRYFRTGSVLRGEKGFVYSVLNFIYDLNVTIILWELTNKLTYDDAIQKNADTKSKLLKDYHNEV